MEIAKTTNQEDARVIQQMAWDKIEDAILASFEGDDVLIQGTTVVEFVSVAA